MVTTGVAARAGSKAGVRAPCLSAGGRRSPRSGAQAYQQARAASQLRSGRSASGAGVALRPLKAQTDSETSSWENWAPVEDEPGNEGGDGEVYEVSLPKPIGVSIARGNDGRCYVSGVNPAKGSVDSRIQPGDKLLRVSQSFGNETWEALNYGQVAYAIRTRNGDVYFQLLKRGGDMSCFEKKEVDEAEAMWSKERAGGNYGAGTKEMQQRNYIAKMEESRKRRELFDDGLDKFKSGDYQGALLDWENVLGLEPMGYMSDRGSQISQIYQVAAFNIACCYSKMGETQAGLEALEEALKSGYEDYDKIRNEPNLATLRESEDFKPLLNRFDEPIFNEDVANAIKGLFGFGKK
mmetsp:Transcript_5050/g.12691  ORF Transcript_5050/g.12691 Transcript_5050/m.12691 type:complete len:351 (-) Transcript_5050:71-1123(-)